MGDPEAKLSNYIGREYTDFPFYNEDDKNIYIVNDSDEIRIHIESESKNYTIAGMPDTPKEIKLELDGKTIIEISIDYRTDKNEEYLVKWFKDKGEDTYHEDDDAYYYTYGRNEYILYQDLKLFLVSEYLA